MNFAFLSPCFHDRYYGGVQLTARLALEALAGSERIGKTKALCYGPECARGGESAGNRKCSRSRLGAGLDALSVRGWPDTILVWHLDLLKLLPLIGAGRKRVFLFLHGVECWRKVEGASRRLLDRVDVFLSNSNFTWNRFVEMNPQCRNAAHRTVLLGAGSAANGMEAPDDIPAVTIVGRMRRSEAYKGHRELIEAWPRVLERLPDAELWVLGGGDAVDDLGQMAEAGGVGKQVRFFGLVSDEEKDRLLRRSRCLALPSRGEGFGLVYLEAMRFGRPCLASIYDAGQEVIEPPQAGVAVDPGNIRELAGALVRLLTPGAEWDEWSLRARRRYEADFTAEHFQSRLLDAVLEEVPV
jgi:phosphatidylinositol alpha-1,6-mannosyltransferase